MGDRGFTYSSVEADQQLARLCRAGAITTAKSASLYDWHHRIASSGDKFMRAQFNSKARYHWYRQACDLPVGSAAREDALRKLAKEADFYEFKHAEKVLKLAAAKEKEDKLRKMAEEAWSIERQKSIKRVLHVSSGQQQHPQWTQRRSSSIARTGFIAATIP